MLRSTEAGSTPGGRVFEGHRPVRLGDAAPDGRIRLDAVARHLQDVATDDSGDSGMSQEPLHWVVRRAAIRAERWPRYLEMVTYATFCSGTGPHWAERRTSGRSSGGGHLEAAALWVAVASGSGRLTALPPRFDRVWGAAANGRRVSARLLHPEPSEGPEGRPWPIRATDIDVLGHVNNATHWEAVEDELARRLPGRIPVAAECEFRLPVDLADAVRVISEVEGGSLRVWLVSDRGVHASAVVQAEAAD